MLGALIGAGATLAGGAMNMASQSKQAKSQKEFAQNAIQWKAADAEKAGISKLYALGANTTSYSPVSVGGGMGDAMSAAGQNIGRAVDASASPVARAGHLATEIAQTQLDGLKIDNDIKRQSLVSQMNVRNQAGQPPAIINTTDSTPMVPGQGNAQLDYKLKRELQPSHPNEPHRVHGVSPEVEMYRTRHGYSPEVPAQLGEAQESQPLAAMQWFVRNKLLPAMSQSHRTYPYEAPEGQYWSFNPIMGEYTLKPVAGLAAHHQHYISDQLRGRRRGPR